MHVITYLSPKCLKGMGKMKKTDFFPQNQDSDNPGQKSLGQYCNVHIFLSFLGSFSKQYVHPFRNFLVVLPPPTLYKVEIQKKILDTRIQHCLWGEGKGWTCGNWKTPQKCKSVSRLLSMIVLDK